LTSFDPSDLETTLLLANPIPDGRAILTFMPTSDEDETLLTCPALMAMDREIPFSSLTSASKGVDLEAISRIAWAKSSSIMETVGPCIGYLDIKRSNRIQRKLLANGEPDRQD